MTVGGGKFSREEVKDPLRLEVQGETQHRMTHRIALALNRGIG